LTGIRHEESVRRSKRNEVEVSNRQYSGDLDGLSDYRKKRNSEKRGRTTETFSIVNTHGEREIGCIRGKETLIINPIIDWTSVDVWMFLNEVMRVPHCNLYGFNTRIGCLCCPMSSRFQKAQEIKRYPHVKRGWINAIKSIRKRGGYTEGIWLKIKELYGYNEDEMAEIVFDWWISGENIHKWYADKFLQTELNFND